MEDTKKPYKSKTIILNLLMALAAFYPPAQAYMVAHPDLLVSGFAVVNILLRLISKDGISLTE